MPRELTVYKDLRFYQDTKFWLMDQPAGPDDVVVGSGDISATYDLKVFDVTDAGRPTQVHSETTGNLTRKASQTVGGTGGDPLWTLGGDGYTMALELDPASWTTPAVPGKSYRIVMVYTSSTWGEIPLIWECECVQRGAAGTLT